MQGTRKRKKKNILTHIGRLMEGVSQASLAGVSGERWTFEIFQELSGDFNSARVLDVVVNRFRAGPRRVRKFPRTLNCARIGETRLAPGPTKY